MQTIARRLAAPVFALTLFSSAALIFVLQPLVGRMVTPLLGGSPSVWNTAMAFFQAALLAGYLYAHVLARLKDVRVQAVIHGLVLITAWLALPLQISTVFGPPSSEQPALWLIGVLALSVGAPFAAAAATAPLLQAWYTRTGRADAHDPYYLYAASNLGSFIGLLAYPALIEPMLDAQAQSLAWSAGYVLVGALIALAAAMAIGANGEAPSAAPEKTEAPSWRTRFYWIAAAAVPSALSLGVTQHISTDVASAPLLWVVPLALYLLTFVIAFARGGERLTQATLYLHPIALALLLASYIASSNWIGSLGGILLGFFFSALICHQALARTRPGAQRLTEFFLLVSLGGVLGGAFAALLAPVIFNNVYEYPLALAAACLFRPRASSDMPRLADASLAGALAMGLMALLLLWAAALDATLAMAALGAAAAMIAAAWSDPNRPAPLRYGFLAIAAVHAALVIWAVANVALKLDFIFMPSADREAQLVIRQPWAALLLASSFLLLCFAVHATIQRRRNNERIGDFALGAAMPSLLLLIMLVFSGAHLDALALTTIAVMVCGVGVFLNRGRPIVLASLILAAFAVIVLDDVRGGQIITQERSFFGVLRTRVIKYRTEQGVLEMRTLMHGTTLHGAQIHNSGFSRRALTYYNPGTALGESILAGLSLGESSHLALIGLGAGSTACLTRANDQLTIFEIDPAVVQLSATAGGDFTFVPECQPRARIELGDARLQIAEAPDSLFDVIVVDAFSSDAIPAHLLTREAIALYLAKLSPRGIVVLHLSNRNLALVSEAARVARDLDAPHLFRSSDDVFEEGTPFKVGNAASVMILANRPDVLARLPLPSLDWIVLDAPPGRAWSDDYINLPRALWESVAGIERCRLYPYLRECGGEPAPAAAME